MHERTRGLIGIRFGWILSAILIALAVTFPSRVQATEDGGNESEGGKWEEIDRDEGITVWRKEVPGSPLIAFRGEGLVDAPVLLVGSVLVDTARATEWVDKLEESRILKKISESEYITYTHIRTPPIIMVDRDFVTHTRIEVDPKGKKMWIRMHSVDDPSAPHTSYIRGELKHSMFELSQITDEKKNVKTRVVTEIHCDPKGNVADWIVNKFQKKWPSNTLKSLREQVKKSDVAVHPRLKAVLQEKGFFD